MMKSSRKIHYSLPKGSIDFWHCDLASDKVHLNKYLEVLDKNELKKANGFKFKADKDCYVITRGVLRILLGRYLNEEPSAIRFDYTPYGKPILSHKNSLHFNVSHSGTKSVLGFVNDSEIGVDIEKIKDDFEVLDIANRFFSLMEIKTLSKIPGSEKNRAFYRCWTRKESFIKAEGSGLSFPLDKFTVSLDHDKKAELLTTDWDALEKDNWSLFSYVPDSGYIGAIATRQPIDSVKYHRWTPFQPW